MAMGPGAAATLTEFLLEMLCRGTHGQELQSIADAARERRADVLLISEQYKWSENSSLFRDASRRAGILVCSADLSVGDFLESNAGFDWVEVAGVRVHRCYFSPNVPFEVFETQILLLEDSLSEAVRRSLIGGDFNSKSPEWDETRIDGRGILVGEMVTENDLILLNRGRKFTFRRVAGGQ